MRHSHHRNTKNETYEKKLKRTGKYIAIGFPIVSVIGWCFACCTILGSQVFRSFYNYTYMDMHHFLGVPAFIEIAHNLFPFAIAFAVSGLAIGIGMILVGSHREGLPTKKTV